MEGEDVTSKFCTYIEVGGALETAEVQSYSIPADVVKKALNLVKQSYTRRPINQRLDANFLSIRFRTSVGAEPTA